MIAGCSALCGNAIGDLSYSISMKAHGKKIFLLTIVLLAALYTGGLGARLVYHEVSDIDDTKDGDIYYLSLTDLAEALQFNISFDPYGFEAVLNRDGEQLKLTLFSSFVELNGDLRNLTYPIIYHKSDFYLPAVSAVPMLADFLKITLVWDQDDKTIRGADLQHNVLDLKFQPRSNGYLCEIMLAHPLEYEVLQTEGNWVTITLQGGRLNENYIANRPHSRVIRKIRAFQFGESAQISINFRRDVTELHHNLALNPPRIQLSIVDTTFDYSSIDTIFVDDNYNPIDIIVIDPGHGGIEDGAIGPNGTKEKDIVLDIAKRLAEKLSVDDKYNVFMTRDRDTTLLLDERAEFANNSSGEMFVSIHVNWFEQSSAKGTQTFFLAAALNDAARATAMLENKSLEVRREGESADSLNDLDLILFDLLQTEYLEESQALASEIQTEMVKGLETRDRGVDQAGFFVLNRVYMPSVLVEVAFISNRHEETLLNKESFREKAAEGIYRGIKNFIDKYSPEG